VSCVAARDGYGDDKIVPQDRKQAEWIRNTLGIDNVHCSTKSSCAIWGPCGYDPSGRECCQYWITTENCLVALVKPRPADHQRHIRHQDEV
jgi:hypothetical protein